jgi:large subunit ribosomal protein L32e
MAAKKFLRHNWFRHSRLGLKWRRPKGRHSKMRENRVSRQALVRIGYRTEASFRDIHPSGLREVIIANSSQLANVDPKTHVVRIQGGVGVRKRAEIIKAAEQKKIKVLNPKQVRVTNRIRGLEARKAQKEAAKPKPRGETDKSKPIPRGEMEKRAAQIK